MFLSAFCRVVTAHTQLAHDVDVRPDAPSLDDYDDVPVEAFGAAMLRGMGWTDGGEVGLTNKAVNKPVAPVQRDGRQVLWVWGREGGEDYSLILLVLAMFCLECDICSSKPQHYRNPFHFEYQIIFLSLRAQGLGATHGKLHGKKAQKKFIKPGEVRAAPLNVIPLKAFQARVVQRWRVG